MKVYFAPDSRAVRTVWLLEEIGQPYELERFTLGQKEMRGPDYAKVNPNGRVCRPRDLLWGPGFR